MGHLYTWVVAFSCTLLVLLSMKVSRVNADAAKDREECAPQLVRLSTCLPYVGNEAKAPTLDCCSGLKTLLKNNKKCLCVIVRDRNDPDLGLNINVTLALGLPSVCNAPANVSQCPALLNMAPNSPEAQVFYKFANTTNASTAASSPAPASSVNGNLTAISPSAQVKSEGYCSEKKWMSFNVVFGGFVMLICVFL